MKFLVVSSSHDPASRSERLATMCADDLRRAGVETACLLLREHPLPPFDNGDLASEPAYRALHAATEAADGLVLASPVYNWGICAELKKYVEYVGSTPGGGIRGAFFDKVVTFVNAAGLAHSYMAFGATALSLMLDFKCIINPYHLYVHNRHWENDALVPEAAARLTKTMLVARELTAGLAGRTYRSGWEI